MQMTGTVDALAFAREHRRYGYSDDQIRSDLLQRGASRDLANWAIAKTKVENKNDN